MSLRPATRAQARRKAFKAGLDVHDGRRRREGKLVEIRKGKREDRLVKKRRETLNQVSQSEVEKEPELDPSAPANELDNLRGIVQRILQGIWSDNPTMQLEVTTQFRKLLSLGSSHSFENVIKAGLKTEEVIKAGVVPRFVEFLSRHELPQLQFETAWALTNITAGTSEHTKVVVDQGAIPKLIQLLSSPCDEVSEQAVWALGNIAGDSPSFRDVVLSDGALLPVIAQLNVHSKISMIRIATWTLSNLCRGIPPPPFEQTKQAISVLRRLIHSRDEEVLSDACYALSYLSNGGTNDSIQTVIEAGVCPRLTELLLHPSYRVFLPAMRTIGNIVAGNDAQTQVVVDKGALPCLLRFLTQAQKKKVTREACWMISNITAGNTAQIQAVIDANIIKPLLKLVQHAEFDVKIEAAWAISNATIDASNKQIHYLVNQGCIKPLCDLLACPDPDVVIMCLKGLQNILKAGEPDKDIGESKVNPYAQLIEECEGLDKIESLQGHSNNVIYEKTVEMLERYWVEEENEAQDAASSFTEGTDLSSEFDGGQPLQPSPVVFNLK